MRISRRNIIDNNNNTTIDIIGDGVLTNSGNSSLKRNM
jgi:hypothetical protein